MQTTANLMPYSDKRGKEERRRDDELTYHKQQCQYSSTKQLFHAKSLYVAVQNIESTEYS